MTGVKPYVREPSRTTWYLAHPRYMRHMAQELSCVFVGIFTLILLLGVRALASGEAAWNAFLAGLTGPWSLALHWLLLLGTCYHSLSWFAVTPKAMRVQIGEGFVPAGIIAGTHYLVWLVVSVIVLYLAGVF